MPHTKTPVIECVQSSGLAIVEAGIAPSILQYYSCLLRQYVGPNGLHFVGRGCPVTKGSGTSLLLAMGAAQWATRVQNTRRALNRWDSMFGHSPTHIHICRASAELRQWPGLAPSYCCSLPSGYACEPKGCARFPNRGTALKCLRASASLCGKATPAALTWPPPVGRTPVVKDMDNADWCCLWPEKWVWVFPLAALMQGHATYLLPMSPLSWGMQALGRCRAGGGGWRKEDALQ